MNISDEIKGTIALFVLTAWFLVYGVSFSEAVVSFQNVIEPPDESIEQSLSLDMDQKTDVTTVTPKSIRLANVDVVTNLQISITLLDSAEYYTPPCGPKLFKLLSTYRL